MAPIETDRTIEMKREVITRALEHWRPRARGSFVVSPDATYVTADRACWAIREIDLSAVTLQPVDLDDRGLVLGLAFPLVIPPPPPPPAPVSPIASVIALGARCEALREDGKKSFGAWQEFRAVPVDIAGIASLIQADQVSRAVAQDGPALVAETIHAVRAARAMLAAAERGRRNFRLAGESVEPTADERRLDEVEGYARKLQKALDEEFLPGLADLAETTAPLVTAALRVLRDRACARYAATSSTALQQLRSEQEAIQREEHEVVEVIQGFDPGLLVPTLRWSSDPLVPPVLE